MVERSDDDWKRWWEETGEPELRGMLESWWRGTEPAHAAVPPPDFHALAVELSRDVRVNAPDAALGERLQALVAKEGVDVDIAATAGVAAQIASWGREALGFEAPRTVTIEPCADGWTVSLEDFQVGGLQLFRYQLDVLLDGPDAEVSRIGLAHPATLTDPDGAVKHLDPEGPWEAHAPLFRLRGATVAQVVVGPDGALHVRFSDGTRLDAPAHADFEAWSIVGPDRLMVVCLPGGGEPAVWDHTTPRYLYRPGQGYTKL